MGFTVEERGLLGQRFLANNTLHLQLITQKTVAFKVLLGEIKGRSMPIAVSGALAVVTRALGVNAFYLPLDWALLVFAAYEVHKSVSIQREYRSALVDMLELYDWVVPNSDALPETDNAEVQQLIECMGTLISSERLMRLEPLATGRFHARADAGIGSYAVAGVRSLATSIGGLFAPVSRLAVGDQQRVLDRPTFTLLVRNLVTHKTTSWFDYHLFGEGSFNIYAGAERLSLMAELTKHAIINAVGNLRSPSPHPHGQ